AHRAWKTVRPQRLKNVPSHATTTGSPAATRYFTTSRATAKPKSSMSQTAPEKNQNARRHCPAIPAAAAIATTVLRSAKIIPHASATNSRRVERRLNAGASSSSRSRHVTGMGRLAGGSIGGHSGHRWCDKHRRCCPIRPSSANQPPEAIPPHQPPLPQPLALSDLTAKLGNTRIVMAGRVLHILGRGSSLLASYDGACWPG